MEYEHSSEISPFDNGIISHCNSLSNDVIYGEMSLIKSIRQNKGTLMDLKFCIFAETEKFNIVQKYTR